MRCGLWKIADSRKEGPGQSPEKFTTNLFMSRKRTVRAAIGNESAGGGLFNHRATPGGKSRGGGMVTSKIIKEGRRPNEFLHNKGERGSNIKNTGKKKEARKITTTTLRESQGSS